MLARSNYLARCIAVLAMLSLTFQSGAGLAQTQTNSSSPVYLDSLSAGWQDWSWGISSNYRKASPVHSGTASIAVIASGWGGLQIGYGGASLDVSTFDTLRFWAHGGTHGGQNLTVIVNAPSGTAIRQKITLAANTWTPFDIPLAALSSRQVYSIQWFNDTATSLPEFYIDDIQFIGAPPPPLALTVNAAGSGHRISPYIYGINFANEQIASDLRLPVRRWGGNSTSRYNWKLDVHNTGSDWFFENIPNPSGTIDQVVMQDRRTNTDTILTMPLMGWTPRQRLNSHPYDCAFKVSRYGIQDNVDPWDTDCGDGLIDGVAIVGNDPTDTSLRIDPSFVTEWIAHLVSLHGTANQGGVQFYSLDNEPMLWNSTHRDIHPEPASYDELRDLAWTYGAAIKAADPSAWTLGPVVWGWTAYFWSALDVVSGGDWWNHPVDRLAHGNIPFVPWYLQQMQAYENAHGVRILDYLDLHYYPQANGVALSPAGNADIQALRLRSTRSLWDTTYSDPSWIGEPVYLIPRMKQWVGDHYPGTRLAITEYNWGALDHMNGALAQADVLGIFGREGLDLATLWAPPESAAAPGIQAFRMYRNYDGQGGSFGDLSLSATSTDQDRLAIYAARRQHDNALTLMVINKTFEQIETPIAIGGFQPAATAAVYRYSGENLSSIARLSEQTLDATGFAATFPANSITLFVIPAADVEQRRLTINLDGAGLGVVTVNPGGMSCATDCSATFTAGTAVTLTATPTTGSYFMGWGGICSGTEACRIGMTGDQVVAAEFGLNAPARSPDLVISAITLKPAKPGRNKTFSAMVTIQNRGTATADNHALSVWANQAVSQPCGTAGDSVADVGTLAAGASKSITIAGLPAGAAGTKTLLAFIDSRCAIAESDESNNQSVKTYTVK